MTTNAKLVLGAVGLVALAVTPAMAKTRVPANRGQVEQVAPPAAYAYRQGYQLPRDLLRYDGYQSDRQIVGLRD